MTKLYLIRHAEAEGNLYRRIQGRYDSLLTPDGVRQLDYLAARFADIPVDAVYASDLYRARTTAGAVHLRKNLPLNLRPDLREIHMGRWEDMSFGEAARTELEELLRFTAGDETWDAGGESFPQARARMTKAFFAISAAHPGQTVVIVSHGSAIRTLLGALHGYTGTEASKLGHSDNTAVSCVEAEGETVRVVFENDNSHLPEELSTLGKQKWWRESGRGEDANLWFRPLDMKTESDLFREARREAWVAIHGSLCHFDGDGFLREAQAQAEADPRAVWCAMLRDEPAGILHLALEQEADERVGRIPFYYMNPEFRRRNLGVQLLGQAVSVYRGLGRTGLRLRCAPDNDMAQRFYARHGFVKIGIDPGSRVPLDILEKSIEVPK